MLSNFKSFIWTLLWVDEQILDLFIIDLNHWNLDLKACISISLLLNSLKYLLTNLRHNSSIRLKSNHGVRFPRSSLPVCKQTAMVSFPRIVKHFKPENIIHMFLIRIRNSTSLLLFDWIWKVITFRISTETIKGPKAVIKGKVTFVSWIICDCGHRRGLYFKSEITILTHS